MRTRVLVAVPLLVFVLAGVARAQCASSLLLEIEVPGVTTFYYDDRSESPLPCVPGGHCPPGGTWVYEEANAQDGLQRGGMSWIFGELDTEICVESETPDKLWL